MFLWGDREALGSSEEYGPRGKDIREACLEYSGTAAKQQDAPKILLRTLRV